MEIDPTGRPAAPARAGTAPAARPADQDRGPSAAILRSLDEARVAVDIRSGLAEARRDQAERRVEGLKQQVAKLGILYMIAPEAFAEFVTALTRQLSAAAASYADGGDPAALRQDTSRLAGWVLRAEEGRSSPPEAGADAAAPAPDGSGGASWDVLVAEARAWLEGEAARLDAERQGGAGRAAAPERAADRHFLAEVAALRQRLDSLFAAAVSRVRDAGTADELSRSQGRVTDRLDESLSTVRSWQQPPAAKGISIIA